MTVDMYKEGMYWVYTFAGTEPGTEFHFYAFREEDARAQYLEQFGIPAGKLLRREHW